MPYENIWIRLDRFPLKFDKCQFTFAGWFHKVSIQLINKILFWTDFQVTQPSWPTFEALEAQFLVYVLQRVRKMEPIFTIVLSVESLMSSNMIIHLCRTLSNPCLGKLYEMGSINKRLFRLNLWLPNLYHIMIVVEGENAPTAWQHRSNECVFRSTFVLHQRLTSSL